LFLETKQSNIVLSKRTKRETMFLLKKEKGKAVLTIYGYVGGVYLDYRNVTQAIADITNDGYKQLDFHLHTYGGYVFDGNMIYNALASFAGQIDVYIDGVAASMGSIIMLAGNRIHIAENAFIMIHAPQGGADGTSEDLEKYAALLRKMEKNFVAKLVERTKKTEDEVKAWLKGDNWFDADDAIAAGLADAKFSPKVKDITTLDKTDAVALGAKGVYERFAAQITKIQDMNKKELIARYGLTTVTEASTDEQIYAAIDAKLAAEKTARESAEAKLADTQKKSIEASVDAAIAAGKIAKEKRDEYVARGNKIGLDELNAIFADMREYKSVTSQINNGGEGGNTNDRKDWDWEKYQTEASAELEAMPKKDPAKFKALYKAKYGVEPEL
jgi:ATP-dependent protease ClpP protease subunit